ncbi:sulfatase family protein [Anatilimnocola floriformis]|uniref:sulfatase family protein n=1 Tax=Anatilimnocola floriformis TaxID=2948575 RepID=UPI0020C20D13|nr:arylsulfatase [Anatilimnocola floriformis]
MPAFRSRDLSLLAIAFALLTNHLGHCQEKPATRPPNIVVIIADDLGYGDVSCNGATEIQTPNIDRLAAEGQRFTSGYCSASTCTPTRYSLLTGTAAFRVKGTGVAPPNGAALIRPGTETLPSILKRAGYATAVIGKWHLGLGDKAPDWNGELKPGPLEIGFDHCFLMPTTNDRVPQIFVEDHRVRNLDPKDPLWVGDAKLAEDHPTGQSHRDTLRMNWAQGHNGTIHNGISRIGYYTGGMKARFRDEDLGDEWVKQADAWMEQQRDKPFFLYFASHDIHVPRMPHERFQGKSKLGFRGDSILEFDWCVGEVVKSLDRLGLTENTLVILCSDNGPVLNDGYVDGSVEKIGDHKPAGPYSGGKYSVLEGGTRIPFITRWKGRIPAGVSEQMVCTIDFAASLAELTKEKIADDGCLDSLNVLGALLGEPGAKGRDYLLQQDNSGNNFGLRAGDWKLSRTKAGMGKQKAQGENVYKLFDLKKDPAEKTNVAAEHPEEAKKLQALMEKVIADGRSR